MGRTAEPLRRLRRPLPMNGEDRSADRDDRAGDLVVEGLVARVPEHPQPADRTHAAEPDLEPPDQAARNRHHNTRPLSRDLVADVQVEAHNADLRPTPPPHFPQLPP